MGLMQPFIMATLKVHLIIDIFAAVDPQILGVQYRHLCLDCMWHVCLKSYHANFQIKSVYQAIDKLNSHLSANYATFAYVLLYPQRNIFYDQRNLLETFNVTHLMLDLLV